MSDERLNEALDRAREAYNDPPETPREEIWREIEARLAATGGADERPGAEPRSGDAVGQVVPLDRERARRRRSPRIAGWAAAAAAVLALGIGIGRMSVSDPASTGAAGEGEVASAVEEAERSARMPSPALRTVAMDHLSRSESLLTLVRSDARSGRVDGEVGAWGRGLLTETRLLLDSPAGEDPALRALLEDLELIFAQVAVLSEGDGSEDGGWARQELRLIAEGLDEQDMLSRIQAVLPAESGLTIM